MQNENSMGNDGGLKEHQQCARSRFLTWLEKNDTNISKLCVVCSDESGWGVHSGAQSIEIDECIVEVPASIMMDAAACYREPVLGESVLQDGTPSDEAAVISLLVWERCKGLASRFEPYIALLPQKGGANLDSIVSLPCLQNSSIKHFYQQRKNKVEELSRTLDTIFTRVPSEGLATLEIKREQLQDKSTHLWAIDMFHSRALSMPVASHDETQFRGPFPALVPFLDLFNHSPQACHTPQTATAHVNNGNDRIKLIAGSFIPHNTEIHINYGIQEPQEMLIRYGFVPSTSLHQVNILLQSSESQEPFIFPILSDCAIPSGLMDFLRCECVRSKVLPGAQENEVISLEQLYGCKPFSWSSIGDGLGNSDGDDEEFFQMHDLGEPVSKGNEEVALNRLLKVVKEQVDATSSVLDSGHSDVYIERLFKKDLKLWSDLELCVLRLVRMFNAQQ